MARRRKTEVKTSVKQQAKPSAVRKSSRQRAKKQQEEQKANGNLVPTNVNNSEDCKDSNDAIGQEQINNVNIVPKKSTRHKSISDQEKSATDSANNQSIESDSQDDLELESHSQHEKSLQDRQVTTSENTLNDVVWPDVIEETIICEEMEVETEVTNSCSITQDGSVVLEQVLLVNDQNYDGKDIVEYTVIQNDDGTESVMVSSNDVHNTSNDTYKNTNNYQIIEQGLSILRMSEAEDIKSSVELNSAVVSENNEYNESCSFNNSDDKSSEDVPKKESESLGSVIKNGKNARTRKLANTLEKSVKRDNDSKKKRTDISNQKIYSTENEVLHSSKNKSTETKKGSTTCMDVVEQYNTQNSIILSQSTVMLTQEDESSSSVFDKTVHQEISEPPITNLLSDERIANDNLISDQQCISNAKDTKNNILNRLPSKSKNSFVGNEEHSRDSETDGKIDCEDSKISSSSENSNDTLLSSNNCKVSDISVDNKSALNQLNEADKKSGFRSRSGSTDTTGSDSGSNSSGVRRSNRIRTIGLMKQRSRGRGLVTKPAMDLSKTTLYQESDKIIRNTPLVQEKEIIPSKNNLDNVSETQSDKENNSNKTTSQDILMPVTSAAGTTGYDSDSNKPVKVKSRWRRSSELEMGSSGSWSTCKPNIGFSTSATTGSPVGVMTNSFSDANTNLPTLPVVLPQESKVINFVQDSMKRVCLQNHEDINVINDTSTTASNSAISIPSTFIPKTIGAKISLPMVSVIEDREMEERLSQFEHLKENLYLTERYTSKETKRMVCDCFLTDEEIQRGELGCGEDCLNRLLMIECGSRCVVGNRCTNKRFQNCEYASCEVFRTEKKGFGLRATCDLKPGEFIMEYVGEVVDPKDFRRRAKEYSKDKNRHYYFMALKSDQIIDATMKGNISRFINHSCDPNAETQKWTVNGELRIGFFNKKFVAAGEEITFDYHFQRYGKEAQKCFCEATNCRGWIGDNPEDSKAKITYAEDVEDTEEDTEDDIEDKEQKENKEEKPEKQVKRKREEKKVTDHMEDEDLEEQIDKLCASGLKNRAHTLTLSRLMVRSREIQHRTRLLKVIRSGEQPCRRLFLDYHGLRLMWSYMMDIAGSTTKEAQQFRLEILKTLRTLPIPNRTMLIDSKVLSVIEKWSKHLYHSPSGDSPEDDQSKSKLINEEMEVDGNEKSISEGINNNCEIKKEIERDVKTEMKTEDVEQTLISEMVSNLLVDWSNLKEVFRIPKKERIEQMKEHEREADRGYKEDVEKEARENSSYERHRSDRYSRSELEKRVDRRKGRDSPDFEHGRSKDKRGLEERPNLVPVPRMSKFERRQLFALKVAKEEEERQRRQQEDSWQQHQAQCLALGLDPYTTAAFDPQSGYPLFFNPQLGQWQAYPIQESTELGQQCRGLYMGAAGPTLPGSSQPVYSVGQPPAGYGSIPVMQMQNGTLSVAPSVYVDKCSEPITLSLPESEANSAVETSLILESTPVLDLPPKWKWARDKRGRIYYYNIKERVSQWLPPPPDHIGLQPDSSTSSESSDETSSSNEEDDEFDELDPPIENMDLSPPQSITIQPEIKKRRDGLVQERIISPRREEDRIDHKKYKEIKEKLKRQKERAKLKEHLEKIRKHRRSSKSKSHSKHNISKFQPITSDMSPTMERKIKDTFRINMANVMVHFLNPYRKNDCKQGRITNTEDFKHLARKLTHFVLAKELKHCKSVDELECNDNVKHKAKDFVRKYMSKFGAVYQKSTDED